MIFHIGYHKTGTSWLQEEIFTIDNGFNALLNHKEVDEYIHNPNIFMFDCNHIQRTLDSRKIEGLVPIVSSEILCGSPYNGGAKSYENSLKLKQVFPDAKIIIGVRNQIDYIGSIYNQYIKTGGVLRLKEFLYNGKSNPSHEGWSFSYLYYANLIAQYKNLFGEDSVYVFDYESMDDKKQFLADLAVFCELDNTFLSEEKEDVLVNSSLSKIGVVGMRYINRLYRSDNHPSALVNLPLDRRAFIKAFKLIGRKDDYSQIAKNISPGDLELLSKHNRLLKKHISDLSEKYEVIL